MRSSKQHPISFLNEKVCAWQNSPYKKPDDEHLKLKFFFIEATAFGRVPILCVFALALLVLVGKVTGLL